MRAKPTLTAAVLGGLLAATSTSAGAGAATTALPAARAATAFTTPGEAAPQLAQHWRGRPYYRPAPRYHPAPRAYVGPGWGYRPWYRRPYYGTIIAGVALGTIIGVTAYGLAPPRPRPDLCWYWADEGQSSGYWDYC